jgi:hypothetical protein
MSWRSGTLGVLMVLQTLSWLAALAVTLTLMVPKPLPPDQIKAPSTSIGIEEGRGGPSPRPSGQKN